MKSLTRWDPFRELEEMSNRLNRLFGSREPARTPADRETMTVADWCPVVDIEETVEDYVIKAELPEVKKEDVKVSVQEGILSIQGERKQEKEQKTKKIHRVERFYGNFMRSFTVPDDVDTDGVRAEFKDGMLYVRLQKSERTKPKAIEIKVD